MPTAERRVSSKRRLSPSWPPALSLTSLFCEENIDDFDGVENDGAAGTAATPQHDPGVELRGLISYFLEIEVEHLPAAGYSDRFKNGGPFNPNERLHAVDWIIKVNAFHGFHPKTAFVSINYLDRFLSFDPLLKGYDSWELLAVTCLKLAAKMGETEAPTSREFKILDSEFVFDLSEVNKMEGLVLCALKWKMRPVSPFDFVDFFSRAALADQAVADVILATRREVELVSQRFSAIAAVAILLERGSTEIDEKLTWIYEKVNKEEIQKCRRLMEEYLKGTSRMRERGKIAKSAERRLEPDAEIVSPLKRQKLR